jgi:hypothetical protein
VGRVIVVKLIGEITEIEKCFCKRRKQKNVKSVLNSFDFVGNAKIRKNMFEQGVVDAKIFTVTTENANTGYMQRQASKALKQ